MIEELLSTENSRSTFDRLMIPVRIFLGLKAGKRMRLAIG
ncbi:hypothetical protein CPter91_0232 [Collimonas pratensis]|uniref:Uncharacterized protein n=1 Tax=Collimonas pratensis TaxID=279113 RepID=A0A127PXW3_9BURK|nr:hypothetical protein CPter91_0232 [Collimonas pratensis]